MFDVDLSKHSLDQLVQKQDQLLVRLNFAYHSGSSGLIESVSRLLRSVEDEIGYRAALEYSQAVVDASPTIIETDPDLAALHKKEVAETEAVDVNQETRQRRPTRRSATPINPSHLN